MSSINSIGRNNFLLAQSTQAKPRPDPAQVADQLFSKLDTSGQGFLQKSDFQSGLDQVAASSNATTSSSTGSATRSSSVGQ